MQLLGVTIVCYIYIYIYIYSCVLTSKRLLFNFALSSNLTQKFLTPILIPLLLRYTQSVPSEDFFSYFMQSVFVRSLFLQNIARIISLSVFDEYSLYSRDIWRSHSSAGENSSLLGYGIMPTWMQLPTFRRARLPPASGSKYSKQGL